MARGTCAECKAKIKKGSPVCPRCGEPLAWGAATKAAKAGFPRVMTKSYRNLTIFQREAEQLAQVGYVVQSQERHPGVLGPKIVVSYQKVG